MRRYLDSKRIVPLITGFLFLCPGMFCQTQPNGTSANTPVGRWVAEHPSRGGIGSWWDFRADGTLTEYLGAIVTVPISRSGNTLTMPSGAAGTPPSQMQFTVKGDSLSLSSDGKELTYTRVGPAPSATNLLLGKWKQNRPKVPNADPRLAALEEAQSNGLYSFNSDGTESVRIPFTSYKGSWNAQKSTLRVQGLDVEYSFLVSGGKLYIGQPPDGRIIDSCLPDPLFE
jgi:hypothetical protein